MSFDLLYILVLAYTSQKATRTRGCKDFIAAAFAMMIFYGIPKMLILGFGWGWTFPFTTNFKAHFISGTISFAIWEGLLLYRIIERIIRSKKTL